MSRSSVIVLMILVVLLGVVPQAGAQIINTLRGFDDEEEGWTGSAAAALAAADGNTEYFELDLDARAQYQHGRNRLRFIGGAMRRTAGGTEIAQSRLGHARHNYQFLPWLSSILFVQGQYDPYLRIESRIVAGAGARVDLFREHVWRSAVGAAAMHESEDLTDNASGFENRYRFSFFATMYRKDAKDAGVDLDFWAFYQPVMDDFGNARVSAAASAQVDLIGNLYFFVNYVIRHNSTPAPGVKKRDQSVRSGVGIDF